jgi:hypothetical protein
MGIAGVWENFAIWIYKPVALEEGLGVFLSGRLRVQIISRIKCIRETKS